MALTKQAGDFAIDAVDIYPFPIRMNAPFTIATMTTDHAPNVLVRIRTRGGLCGWGEASPLHSITGETQAISITAGLELGKLVMGRHALEIGGIVADMDRFLPHTPTIKSAFDMALFDIAAQAAGMPLYRFLGGAVRLMETDITLGIGNPADAGAEAEALLRHGTHILKVKLGVGYEADLERLAAVRLAVGDDITIRIDANQGYDRVTAERALNAFADLDIEFCEQPVPAHDHHGLAAVSQASPIPIMADEALFHPSDALRLVEDDAAPLFNIKLSKSGGIWNSRKIAQIAEAGGIRCMIGCMLESRLGLTAAAHFACTAPCIRFFDVDTCFEQSEDPIEGGLLIVNGVLMPPETPGLGAAPDQDLIRRLERVS